MPQPEGGSQEYDVAIGGGYVCTVYTSQQTQQVFALVVDQATNATILFECISVTQFASSNLGFVRVCFAGGKFILAANKVSDGSLLAIQFTPGSSATAWSTFATVSGASANSVTALDVQPIANPATGIVAIAFSLSTVNTVSIPIYDTSGSVTATASIAGIASVTELWIDGDRNDNTLAVFTIRGGSTTEIRTFSVSAGALLLGPAATTVGFHGGVCRLKGSPDKILVAVHDGTNLVIQQTPSTLLVPVAFATVGSFTPRTRLVASAPGCLIAGALTDGTNALFYIESGVAHVVTRDLSIAAAPSTPCNLGSTSSTGGVPTNNNPAKLAWVCAHSNGGLSSFGGQPAVTVIDAKQTARSQRTQYGGLHYSSGAAPWIYDGRIVSEIGFQEIPVISIATPSSGAGSLAPNARYTYTAHWEFTYADGSFVASAPSVPGTVATGATDTRVTLTVTTPHSLRVALGGSIRGCSVTLVISRTVWSTTTVDPATGVVGFQFSQLRRSKEVDIAAGMAGYGISVVVIDGTSDTALATRGVLYTQGDRGELSGPVEHDAPEPNSYIAASDSRLYAGGLVRPFEIQVSKDAFLGQPVEWSILSQFYCQADAPIRGVYAMDQIKLAFTRDDVFVIPPQAPDDEGKGSVGDPVRLPSATGLKDWRSFLLEQGGLWYQGDDDKLMRIPRGGGTPQWDGKDVQDTLATLPIITAAARHRADHIGLFAINNTALTTAKLLVRDLLFETWFTDSPPLTTSRGIEALCVSDRAVAYASGGFVFRQVPGSFTDNVSSFIDMQAGVGPIYPGGVGANVTMHDLMFTAEYRGDCNVTLNASFDDGKTFPFTVTFAVTGLTSGARVRKRWALPQVASNSVFVEVNVNTAGAPTEGLVLNEIDILFDETPGDLLELDPGDCA